LKRLQIEPKTKHNYSGKKIIKSLNIGVKLSRDEIKKRITARLKKRLENFH
jgi:hypothetical protein